MSLRRKRLTNFYYAQSSPQSDPGITWDSDNSRTRLKIADSPRFAKWCAYCLLLDAEEELHEKWKSETSKSENVRDDVHNMCGWRVRMFDTTVWYTYRPTIDGVRAEDVRFKIKFQYLRPVRRWFLRLGHSFLPEIEDWSRLRRRKFINGVRNPLNGQIMTILCKIRQIIDVYMLKKRYVDEFLESVEEDYPDLKVTFDKTLANVTLVYGAGREEVWIPGYLKTTVKDSVTISIDLDAHFIAKRLEWFFTCDNGLPREIRQRLENDLIRRVDIFLRQPLKEAFQDFMSG